MLLWFLWLFIYFQFKEEVFAEWINPIFLDPIVQSEIQEKFENDSEIELQEFLRVR